MKAHPGCSHAPANSAASALTEAFYLRLATRWFVTISTSRNPSTPNGCFSTEMKASPEAPSIKPLTTNWPQQGSKLPIVTELPEPEDVDSSQLDYALESAESLVNHRSLTPIPRVSSSVFLRQGLSTCTLSCQVMVTLIHFENHLLRT